MIGFDLGVLPAEVDLLESYLNRANQDPVQYVRTTLQNTPPPYFDRAFRSFLEIEMCSLTKEQIVQLYKIIFYGREAHFFFLRDSQLEAILNSALEYCEFNYTTLSNIFSSFFLQQHSSYFYRSVFLTEQHHFLGFYQLHLQETMEQQQRDQQFLEMLELERKSKFLLKELSR